MTTATPTQLLTDGQRRFAGLLQSAPYLAQYWDLERGDCDIDALRAAMGAWSHGEQIMGKFMVGLWLGADKFEFDVFEAAATLDEKKRAIIAEWLERPFWP